MGAETGTPPSRYLAGGLSEKGRRESNEDAAILAVLPPSSALRAYAVLSDGMGGHNAGEVASRLAVEIFKEKVQAFAARPDVQSLTPAEIEAEIREWIGEVNREIYQRGKASAEQKGMGATLAFAMVLADDRLVVANVGDSRVFLVSGLSVRQLSVDHTALAEQRRALGSDSVAPEDDASNPFAHALTRSLGQEKKVVPDVRSDVALGPGDVVILTTDGVTDVLEAERFLTALEATGSLQEAADEIYRLAFEAGTKDNVSVALLSRGTPARLGLGKAGPPASVEPPPSRGGDGMLIAGAASAPLGGSASRPRSSRLVAFGVAALALLAVVLALGVLLAAAPSADGPAGRRSSHAGGAGIDRSAFRCASQGCDAASRGSLAFAAGDGDSRARRAYAGDAASLSATRARAGRAVVPDSGCPQRAQAARVSADADRDVHPDPHADADRDGHAGTHDRSARAPRKGTSRARSPARPDARRKRLRSSQRLKSRQRLKTRNAARTHAATKARIPSARTRPATPGREPSPGKTPSREGSPRDEPPTRSGLRRGLGKRDRAQPAKRRRGIEAPRQEGVPEGGCAVDGGLTTAGGRGPAADETSEAHPAAGRRRRKTASSRSRSRGGSPRTPTGRRPPRPRSP